MKLYLLTQTEADGYDTYDSCIVCADNEEAAKCWHPSEHFGRTISSTWGEQFGPSWATSPANVEALLIGEAAPNLPEGVVLASFNAG